MKTIIIEDEEAASRRLKNLIQDIDPSVEVIGQFVSIEETVNFFEDETNDKVDLAFFDIQLADGSSFDVFNLTDVYCPVVFTTAYDEYALQAFKVNALDYLLKPIKKGELYEAIIKYKDQKVKVDIDWSVLSKMLPQQDYKKRFLVRLGRQIKLFQINEIAYFYTESKTTYLSTYTGKRYPMEASLDKLEELIDPNLFFRANRQYILNLKAIKEMYTYSKSRVKVITEPAAEVDIIVSTDRSSRFKKWLSGSLY